jgi:methyl-accepting chemotaxis protein
MNIRQRIILLVALTFIAIAAIGGYAVLQSRRNASAVVAVTEGVVPSTLATADLVAKIKDVQLTTVAMVSASDRNLADQAAEQLKKLKVRIADSVEQQLAQVDNDKQRALLEQVQESLGNYFAAVDETTAFVLAGRKELAEATLFANVAEYQSELGAIVETLRIEKNRSNDGAVSELNERLARATLTLVVVTVIATVLLSAIGALLYVQISRPLHRMQDGMSAIKKRLDLTLRLPVAGANEMDHLAAGVNSLLDEFQAVVKGMQDAGSHVARASDGLSHSVAGLTAAIEQQNDSTSSMAASVEELAVSVAHVSESSVTARQIAQTSLTQAEDGGQVIEKTVGDMIAMAETVQTTSQAMQALGKRSGQIGSIAGTIKEIAEQTNLLALNAAIEAARAGEMGRGFAVVADEVRKLAERTTSATSQIASVIGAIQNETTNAVVDMHRVAEQVTINAEDARQAGASIVRIRGGSLRVVSVASEISTALAEQSAASDQIAKQIERIASMSEANTAAMSETMSASHELGRLSDEMHRLVARFQV